MLTQNSQKSPQNFVCENCDYCTCKKSDFEKHKRTQKHINTDKMMTITDDLSQKVANEKKYKCLCGKSYSHRQSLYVHKKVCNSKNNSEELQVADTNNPYIVEYLLKENSELKNMILDVCKNMGIQNNSHSFNNTNSHNKTFNLQFFLNETCKDAMNIMDFVDSVKLQLSDLENVGEIGYIEGISNIIVKNLNALDETKRPVHCTDTKREVLYIKDDDKWEKENEDRLKLRKMIKRFAYKNAVLLPAFKEKYPEYNKSSSKQSDKYNKLIIEVMGGRGDNELEKEDKIIRKIAKEVTIDKSNY
jgi:hypothetical protein